MTASHWPESLSHRAMELWTDYQRHHDLTDKTGQTVGIDPVSGRVWFGTSIQSVIALRDAEKINAPLYFVRVGSTTYYRKGGRR